jgi:hypothetical protein
MGKNPAYLFYPGDWQRDLDDHDIEIEGAWQRFCCRMWWAPQRGRLTLRPERWAVILNKDIDTTNRIIDYLLNEKIASGQREANGYVTLWSRRMMQDEKDREHNRLRQRRFRGKEGPNAEVTPPSRKRHVPSSVSVTVSKNKDKGKRTAPFVPPMLQEVSGYCKERNNSIDPQAFIDHYTSNGWMVGKNKMKDWKAAVRNWEKRNFTPPTKTLAIIPIMKPKEYISEEMPEISEADRIENMKRVKELASRIG